MSETDSQHIYTSAPVETDQIHSDDGSDKKLMIQNCIREFAGQFNCVSVAMTNITNILLDFVNGVEVCRSELLPRIVSLMGEVDGDKLKSMTEWLPFEERKLFGVVGDRLSECERLIYNNMNKITDLRYTDYQQQSTKIGNLEQHIEEKNKEIQSLKTSENVMLWQKEKTRILRDHEDQINQLRKSIEIIEDKNSSLRRKLSEQSDDLKLEKMKVDLKKRRATYMAPDSSDLALLEELKRRSYLYEKDIQYGQQKLNRFQTDMLGLWGGLQGEINSIAAKCKDMTVSGMLISMNSTVDMIKSAVAGHVDVRVMRADLNERYLPGLSNMDFFVTHRGKKVTIKPINMRKFSKQFVTNQNLSTVKINVAESDNSNSEHKEEKETEAVTSSASNPKLLNDMYGTLDTLAVMKHFPTLSSAYVKEQWNNFKRYDTDGNGELDMAEIMKAITGLMPTTIKPSHIEAAMREVDSDGSGTMDFYEYLQVAMLLERKKGKSELFHTPDITKYNKQISKTCLIQ